MKIIQLNIDNMMISEMNSLQNLTGSVIYRFTPRGMIYYAPQSKPKQERRI